MVDNTKWDSGQVIMNGVLDRPMPRSSRPVDSVLASVDEDDAGEEKLRKGLEAGGLSASMYYGCWAIWKTTEGFSGELMQYRNCTDSFRDQPMEVALEKAEEWFLVSYG